MNFYTLTFRRQIKYTFIILFILFLLLNLALFAYINSKTTKESFINSKSSKIKHFKLNNPYNKDIIFIGNSRTFYNISSNYFNKRGLSVFNLGIAGAKLTDMPFVIKTALHYKPKYIVVSISYFDFDYVEALEPTLFDMRFLMNVDTKLFLKNIGNFIYKSLPFFNYSESIYNQINSFYHKFDLIPSQNIKNKILNKVQIKSFKNYIDCNIFDKKYDTPNHLTLKCTNGDGIIIGHEIKKEFNIQNVNNELFLFFLDLTKYLKENNQKYIVVVEPTINKVDQHKLIKFLEKNNIPFLDLSYLEISNEFWADNGHLNILGRKIYSSILYKRLKNYVEN